MKKWWVAVAVALILTLISIYILIPSKIRISEMVFVNASINGSYRFLSDQSKWAQWWHSADSLKRNGNTAFTYHGWSFSISGHSVNTAGIRMRAGKLETNSIVSLFSFAPDSTGVLWETTLNAGNNPFNRVRRYRKATDIKRNMTGILENFKSFISDPKNVYGISIYRGSTTDTLLLCAKYKSKTYPTTNEIYNYLNPVKERLQKQHAQISGFPMINITRSEDSSFETQVAIPTDRLLTAKDPFFVRRMVPGNFMICEVKGGNYTINEGLKQLEYFMNDYRKTQMAIPFESLITDRMKEPDSSRWVTRLYMPARR